MSSLWQPAPLAVPRPSRRVTFPRPLTPLSCGDRHREIFLLLFCYCFEKESNLLRPGCSVGWSVGTERLWVRSQRSEQVQEATGRCFSLSLSNQ